MDHIFLSSVYPDNSSGFLWGGSGVARLPRVQEGTWSPNCPVRKIKACHQHFTPCSLVPLSVQPLRGYFSTLKSVTTPAFAFCLLKSIELFQLWLLSLSAVLVLAELWEGEDKQVSSACHILLL